MRRCAAASSAPIDCTAARSGPTFSSMRSESEVPNAEAKGAPAPARGEPACGGPLPPITAAVGAAAAPPPLPAPAMPMAGMPPGRDASRVGGAADRREREPAGGSCRCVGAARATSSAPAGPPPFPALFSLLGSAGGRAPALEEALRGIRGVSGGSWWRVRGLAVGYGRSRLLLDLARS
jgi:hypothetical protein